MTRNPLIVIHAIVALLWISGAEAKEVGIVLMGGSSVRTSYFPAEDQHHRQLQAALSKAAPGEKFKVVNWADNGEFVARYLLRGRYDRQRQSGFIPKLAILRFGVNDQKYSTREEVAHHVSVLGDLLIHDFPGITIALETGLYVDFPAHYHYDRESILKPYWEAMRELAAERGWIFIDTHAVSKKETEAGNWDQRIRLTDRKSEPYVFDNRLDPERASDTKWFSDIHPNYEGVRIAIATEVPAILSWLKNPKPSQPTSLTIPEERDYTTLLNFAPERLDPRKNRRPGGIPADHLQTPINP